jgi:hypothetical protein
MNIASCTDKGHAGTERGREADSRAREKARGAQRENLVGGGLRLRASTRSSPPWSLCFIKERRIIFLTYPRGIFGSAPLNYLSAFELETMYFNIHRHPLIVVPKHRVKATGDWD